MYVTGFNLREPSAPGGVDEDKKRASLLARQNPPLNTEGLVFPGPLVVRLTLVV
jgi:hypothetical protein